MTESNNTISLPRLGSEIIDLKTNKTRRVLSVSSNGFNTQYEKTPGEKVYWLSGHGKTWAHAPYSGPVNGGGSARRVEDLPCCPFCGGGDLRPVMWDGPDGEVDAAECNNCLAGAPLEAWKRLEAATGKNGGE